MGGEVLAMAPVTRQSLMMAAGVPIWHPLVRQTGQQRGINSRSSSTHHGETEPARPSSPAYKAGEWVAFDCARHHPLHSRPIALLLQGVERDEPS